MTKGKIFISVIVIVIVCLIGYIAIKSTRTASVEVPVETTPVVASPEDQIEVLTMPLASSTPLTEESQKEQVNVLQANKPPSTPSAAQQAEILKALQAK